MAKTANSPYGALQLNSASAVQVTGWGYRCERCRGGLGLRVTKDVGGSDLYKVVRVPLTCPALKDRTEAKARLLILIFVRSWELV